jgi:lysozyme
MKASNNCYLLIREFEGYSAGPYLDVVKIPTIGYGNTQYKNGKKVTLQDKPLDIDEAKSLSAYFIDKFASDVDLAVTSNVNQNQFDALVSFAYNVGLGNLKASTLLKKVNINPNDTSIANEFIKWNKGTKNGIKIEIQGLTNRRRKEANLYFSQH